MEDAERHILLVEDEDFIRDLYKRQLDLENLKTDAFGNGKDGLAALAQKAYDLILLDIMLPGMNGLEILKHIKQSNIAKDTPVVLLTNLGQESVMKEAFALGAKDYIIKASVTPAQIVEKVKELLRQQGSSGGSIPPTTVEPPNTTQ